ncbi:hypothetical protein GGS21DRAFT_412435 [Xylaria nigripes]|nr:hypothetical protein GGS21DRAFT_412435 [Xylaria nigripes]
MADKAPLVRGGYIMNSTGASENDEISSYSTAFFHPRAYILAAVSSTTCQSAPDSEGWFMSDFFALNAILRGVGSNQTWLTVADIDKIIERHGELLHGNPFREPRVVLSRDLLESGKITRPTRVRLGHLTTEFLRHAGELSTKAWRENVPLILGLFCHGSGKPTYELSLDGAKSTGLRALQLKSVLEPGAQVVVLTTACFSGGWMIDKSFNSTMATAATHKATSTSWPLAKPFGMTGSVFVTALIKRLASTTSPFLTNGCEEGQSEAPLQPAAPTKAQNLSYNAFCWAIWESCRDVTRLWHQHSFAFGCQDDRWDRSWSGAMGIPLNPYEKKWLELPIRQYPGDPGALDQDPSNDITEVTAGTVAHGSATSKVCYELRQSLSKHDVKALANLFVNHACPGDWQRGGSDGSYLAVLIACANGNRPGTPDTTADPLSDSDDDYSMQDEVDVHSSILYRWEATNFADFLLRKFQLPKPQGQDCLFWEIDQWYIELKNDRDADAIDDEVIERLWLGGFPFKTTPAQGPDFMRPLRYVTAAIVIAKLEPDARRALVESIVTLIQGVEKYELKRMTAKMSRSPVVRARAKDWLTTLGQDVVSTEPHVG